MRLEDVVRHLGGEVVGPTASVAEALALASGDALDGAVLDVNLGGIPVYAVADRLALQDVPFVFLTGHTEAVPPAYADRRVLPKPFGAADITRLLLEAFNHPAAADTDLAPPPPREAAA
jgi:CheY-like chemotaxis protein